MRISTNQLYQSGNSAINSQQSALLEVYQQISSGRRMVTPAEDPLAASQVINISQAKSLNDRLAANRNTAMQNLSLEEDVLDNVTLRYQDIQTRIVEASNETLSDADRNTLAQVVRNLRDTMFGLANSADGNGQFLFSGHQGDRAPFATQGDGSVGWQADQGKRMIQIDQARQVSSSDDGMTIFLKSSPGDMSYVTSGSAANTGTASISTPVITNPAGANVGMDFDISFSGAPAEYTVSVFDKSGAPIGAPVGPTPFDPSTGIVTLPGGVDVTLKGEPVDGDSFSVRNVRGEDINVFDTLDKLAAALETPVEGNPAAGAKLRNILTEAGQKIQSNSDSVGVVRAAIGSRINELEALDGAGEQRSIGLKSELSRLEDLDLYTSTMNLNMRLAGMEAATLAFQKIQSLSLFSMKR